MTSPPKITGKMVAPGPGPEDVVVTEGGPEDSGKSVAVPVVCVAGAEVGSVVPEEPLCEVPVVVAEPPCVVSVIFGFGVEFGFDVPELGVEFGFNVPELGAEFGFDVPELGVELACVVPDEPPVELGFGFGDVGKLPGLEDAVVCVFSPGLEL